MKRLVFSYTVLALITVGAVAAYWLFPEQEWVRHFSPNVATTALGILLAVVLIDNRIRDREERFKGEQRSQALFQLGPALHKHYEQLMNMYKASVREKPVIGDTPAETLDSAFVSAVTHLNFLADAPVGPGAFDWCDYLTSGFRDFKDALSRTVDAYAFVLDGATIGLLERVASSSFLSTVSHSRIMRDVTLGFSKGESRKWPLPQLALQEDRIFQHVRDLLELVEIYDREVGIERRVRLTVDIWRDDMAPALGSARTTFVPWSQDPSVLTFE